MGNFCGGGRETAEEEAKVIKYPLSLTFFYTLNLYLCFILLFYLLLITECPLTRTLILTKQSLLGNPKAVPAITHKSLATKGT